MKRLASILPIAFFLSGCAQLFEVNLYEDLDQPPPLNVSDLSKTSVTDLQKKMDDPAFVEQLKNDEKALKAVQDNLNQAIDNATTTEEKLDAATTLITISADATKVTETKNNVIKNIPTIKDALTQNPIPWGVILKIFLAGQNEAEITSTLNTLVGMSVTLATMQTVSTDPITGTVNSTVFFSRVASSEAPGFAQTALMAAVVKAMASDLGSVAILAKEMAKDEPDVSSGGDDMTKFGEAWESTLTVAEGTATPGSGYSYAYLSALKSKTSFEN